jgi:N-acylneuraminate cytidylyltransferase/CMP-N,N'-diacetyllegionaminic acid synthase
MKLLAFVPARGGSKSIPNKNLYKILNKPLIQYTLEALKKSKIFYKIIVSSDSDKIIRFCNKFSGINCIKRPKNLSKDNSPTEEALAHSLSILKKKTNTPDYICVCEPTAPLRSYKSLIKLKKVIKKKKNINSLITVCELDHIPGTIKNNSYKYITYDRRNRQKRKKFYIETGTFFLVKYNYFMRTNNIISKKPFAFFVPKIEGIDINNYEDLEIAKSLLKKL